MRKSLIFLGVVFLFACQFAVSGAEVAVEGLLRADKVFVRDRVDGAGDVFAVSGGNLYAYNRGHFSRIYTFKSDRCRINHICFDKVLAGKFYAASDAGLFVTFDNGRHFEKIFSPGFENEDDGRVQYVMADGEKLYAGTDNGLYISDKNTFDLKRSDIVSRDEAVYSIVKTDDEMFVLTSGGLYRSRDGFLKKCYIRRAEKEDDSELSFAISFDRGYLYAAVDNGVWSMGKDDDSLKTFKPSLTGIIKAGSVCAYNGSLYIATGSGVFSYMDGEINRMSTINVKHIAVDRNGVVWCAADTGVYKLFTDTAKAGVLSVNCGDLPRINDLHKVVLRYNEVGADKINSWRRRVKVEALMPEVSVDYDKNVWGSSSSGGAAFVGPRDWSLGFSWDVGELVWNSDETSIDTRSKLNTQLRLDILDEVNRLYFELKKLMVNGLAEPDDSLRAEELVASLDGYTGGWFSRALYAGF